MANMPATPAALSQAPGASRRSPSRTGLSGVRGGKDSVDVRREHNDGTGAVGGRAVAGRVPRTLPDGVDFDIAEADFE